MSNDVGVEAISGQPAVIERASSLAANDSSRGRSGRIVAGVSVFTDAELRYLTGGRQLGRIATVGADGTPHVVPVGWIYNAASDTIVVGGHELERSKKFQDVARTGRRWHATGTGHREEKHVQARGGGRRPC